MKPPTAYLRSSRYGKILVQAACRLWVQSTLPVAPGTLRQDVARAGEAPCPRHTLPRSRATSALLKPVLTSEPRAEPSDPLPLSWDAPSLCQEQSCRDAGSPHEGRGGWRCPCRYGRPPLMLPVAFCCQSPM